MAQAHRSRFIPGSMPSISRIKAGQYVIRADGQEVATVRGTQNAPGVTPLYSHWTVRLRGGGERRFLDLNNIKASLIPIVDGAEEPLPGELTDWRPAPKPVQAPPRTEPIGGTAPLTFRYSAPKASPVTRDLKGELRELLTQLDAHEQQMIAMREQAAMMTNRVMRLMRDLDGDDL